MYGDEDIRKIIEYVSPLLLPNICKLLMYFDPWIIFSSDYILFFAYLM